MKHRLEVEDISLLRTLQNIINFGGHCLMKYTPEEDYEEFGPKEILGICIMLRSFGEKGELENLVCFYVKDIDLRRTMGNYLFCKKKPLAIYLDAKIVKELLTLRLLAKGYGSITTSEV